MATYNLRRFSHADALKTIGHTHLLALLSPHRGYLSARGVGLPGPEEADGVDYDALVSVLMAPDSDTPPAMADALYFIHEMATPEGMDTLLQEAERNGIPLDDGSDHTPADVAVQVWLRNPDLLERKHAEQFLTRPRTFEYFQTDRRSPPEFEAPTPRELKPLESALDDWFEGKKRGRGCRVFVFPRADGVWFLVRHGDPFKREGSIKDGESSSVFYRPEKHDVLVYQPKLGELRMNAASKGEKDLYRTMFGLHLFGSEEFFPGRAKYSLEPLRDDGEMSLVCTDVEGIEWVKLKEIHFFWGGSEGEVEIRKANDIFAALAARNRTLPQKARIVRAGFHVKFADAKPPRSVTLRPSNVAQYARDSDAEILEEWLLKRGFIRSEEVSDHEEAAALLADA